MVEFTGEQVDELKNAYKTHPVPYVRIRALALLSIAKGKLMIEVAEMMEIDRHTVARWLHSYQENGMDGLTVKSGRGRKSSVNEAEVLEIAMQSPRNFGLNQERWTLEALRKTAPSLGGLSSLSSVMYVLERIGLSVKRGQPAMVSPDPDYAKKKNSR
jgi:transposase